VAASTKAGSRVIASEIRTLLTSLPSATTWATSVSVMIPTGLAGLAVEDHQRRHC
jgi:hypothetical protein